jgi:hypothetical protein
MSPEEPMSTPSFHEALRAARDALGQGDARAAFGHVRFGLAHEPTLVTDRDRYAEAFGLFARISEALAGPDLAALVRRTVEDPDDVRALYDLGYELIEQGLPGVAATALARANLLFPNQGPILTELSAALERDCRCREAAEALRAAPELVESDFFCRYLLAYNGLMTGDLDEPRGLLPGLFAAAADVDRLFMARRVEGMLARADAVRGATPLDGRDLRGWHLVVTGGLLLHLSPYGFDEGMNGRYAYTQDGPDRCLEGIRRLAAVLQAWDVRPPRVWRLEGDSAALAVAAGAVLGCPVEPWPAGGADAGLVAAYDLATLPEEAAASLREHRPGQVLWAHASCWTEEPPFAADLTTYLYQYNVSPWGERLRVDPETRKTGKVPPSTAAPEERAAEVLAAQPEADALADLPRLTELARAAQRLEGEHGPGALRGEGRRRRQGTNSPVPSSRFF